MLIVLFFLFLFSWPLILYPATLLVLHRLRRAQTPPSEPVEWPSVALVICALNEQRVIGEKLENSLQLDYPRERLRIVVISDGSTDDTAAIVRRYAPQGVELINQPRRRGKVTNLNEIIPARPEEFIVLSDANVLYDPQAIRRLIPHFADPKIGCVSGKVVLVNTTADLQQGEGSYYSVEWLLQEEASRLHSMVGADGAMYALRRSLFRPCPPDTLIEDLVIPVSIVNRGYRAILEPSAHAREDGPSSVQEEFRRKIRIAAGAAQALLRGNGWPTLSAPLSFWFVFVSHKLLRWLTPLTALGLLISAAVTWNQPLSMLVLAGAAAVASLAAIRWLTGWSFALLDAPFYLVFGQIAVLRGLWRGAAGTQSVLWDKVNR